jgi:integrase
VRGVGVEDAAGTSAHEARTGASGAALRGADQGGAVADHGAPAPPTSRHSAATLLLGIGVHPKIVSELLGHTQIGITLDLYSHVTATMQRDAVQAFEELLGSSQGSNSSSKGDEAQQDPS